MPPDKHAIVSGGLLRLLADTAVLHYKTRHLTWRLGSDLHGDLQAILRKDHTALDKAIDEIAQHVVALGREITAELRVAHPILLDRTGTGHATPQMDMIAQIAADHEQILADIETLEAALPLDEDEAAARLLDHLAACHASYKRSLGTLLPKDDETLQYG